MPGFALSDGAATYVRGRVWSFDVPLARGRETVAWTRTAPKLRITTVIAQ
jgi:hypothetical protein